MKVAPNVNTVADVAEYLVRAGVIRQTDSEIGAVVDIREAEMSEPDLAKFNRIVYGRELSWATDRIGAETALKYIASEACKLVRLNDAESTLLSELRDKAEAKARKMAAEIKDPSGEWSFMTASARAEEQARLSDEGTGLGTKKNPERKVGHGNVRETVFAYFKDNPTLKREEFVAQVIEKFSVPVSSANIYFYAARKAHKNGDL